MWIIRFESGAEMKVRANDYFAAKARAEAICKSSKRGAKFWAIVKLTGAA